jgi:hypothetical protein
MNHTLPSTRAYLCAISGLVAGLCIGPYDPVIEVAHSCETGAATNIIYGLALGYLSVVLPVILLSLACIHFSQDDWYAWFGLSCLLVWLVMLMVQSLITLVVLLKWQDWVLKQERKLMRLMLLVTQQLPLVFKRICHWFCSTCLTLIIWCFHHKSFRYSTRKYIKSNYSANQRCFGLLRFIKWSYASSCLLYHENENCR